MTRRIKKASRQKPTQSLGRFLSFRVALPVFLSQLLIVILVTVLGYTGLGNRLEYDASRLLERASNIVRQHPDKPDIWKALVEQAIYREGKLRVFNAEGGALLYSAHVHKSTHEHPAVCQAITSATGFQLIRRKAEVFRFGGRSYLIEAESCAAPYMKAGGDLITLFALTSFFMFLLTFLMLGRSKALVLKELKLLETASRDAESLPVLRGGGPEFSIEEFKASASFLQVAQRGLHAERVELEELSQKMEAEITRGSEEIRRLKAHYAKQAQELEEAKSKVEDSLRNKNEFYATLGHEIRTPLQSLFIRLSLMGETRLDDEQLHLLSQSQDQMSFLLRRINHYLDYSRILKNKTPSLSRVNVRLHMREILSAYESLARDKNLKIYLVIRSNVDSSLFYDKDALDTVLGNLISNAIKHSDKGAGEIVVRLSQRELNDRVVEMEIQVVDHGGGIEETDYDRIFEPGVRLEVDGKAKSQSTGIGLAMVKETLEDNFGRISVFSRKGQGSIFTAHVPVTREKSQPRPSFGNRKIVLVSDDPHWREAWCEVSRYLGYEPLAVTWMGMEASLLPGSKALVMEMAEKIDEARVNALANAAPLAVSVGVCSGLSERLELSSRITRISEGLIDERRVQVFLGLATEPAAPTPQRSSITEKLARRPESIAVVEDNALFARQLQRDLIQAGFDPDVYEDGGDFLRAIREGYEYDFVLMDNMLKTLNAKPTLESEDAQIGLKNSVIWIASASVFDQNQIEEFEKLGVSGFVEKPYDTRELAGGLAAAGLKEDEGWFFSEQKPPLSAEEIKAIRKSKLEFYINMETSLDIQDEQTLREDLHKLTATAGTLDLDSEEVLRASQAFEAGIPRLGRLISWNIIKQLKKDFTEEDIQAAYDAA